MVIGIDFTRKYEIKTSYQGLSEIKTKTITGEELYQQLKQTITKIKEKYFGNKNALAKRSGIIGLSGLAIGGTAAAVGGTIAGAKKSLKSRWSKY